MTAATPAVRERRGFRTDVQGLRAIAVGLVLVYHAGIPIVTGGYVGVDVFFVISGFLISSHLLESLERHGRIRFADFYARRIRRILPASLTVALLTAVAAIVFLPPLALERVLKDALATILYVPNVWFAIQNTDYLADHSPSPYQHYWSLGVEEQFYLFWPLILLALFVLLRRRTALIVAAIAATGAASLVAGIVVTPVNQPAAFFLLPTRAWELLIGALVGAVLLHGAFRVPSWLGALGGWLGIAMVLASAVLYDDATVFPGTAAILPTVGTALVILFGAPSPAWGPTWLLSLRPMQFIGLISYSLYLVHWPLLIITQSAVGEEQPLRLLVKIGLGIVLAVPLAWLLFRFVETPLRAPGWLTRRRPRFTLIGTLALTVVLAGSLVGVTHWSSVREVGTGDAVAEAPDFPSSPPHGTGFVPRNMTPSLGDVAADLPVLYADGCHHDVSQEEVQDCAYGDGDTVVAVFGDSHAAQWFPAISAIAEKRDGIVLSAYTKSSCPAVSTTVLDKDVPYMSCDRWREAVLTHLEAKPPALVVISSYAHYDLPDVSNADERKQRWDNGMRATVERLRTAGSEVLVIADTPRFETPPATCISADVLDTTRCDGVRDEVLDSAFTRAEARAVTAAGGEYVDVTPYICAETTCPVIVDDLLVYRDVNHLTTAFVSYLSPVMEEPLLSSLSDEG
ncbi:acyltransferase [Microbacterium aerolatum]|uniref:acyltransferase family protein n=1 Tax=Microbacterium aerolatum TaxID=153731 RepID=UPI00384B53BF